MRHSLRSKVGTMLFDRPRCAWVLQFPRLARWLGSSWIDFHNRREQLLYSPDARGVVCDWQWSSDLTVSQVFPGIANRLLKAALAEWPIQPVDQLPVQPEQGPLVSFIIGHRGLDRLPHLLATLRSILGQSGIRLECIVVEQACETVLGGRLPAGVRHIHLQPPTADLPYSRSWTFNVGARAARGDILVFHDNDLLVPADYGKQIVEILARGYQVARLHRFVFYLTAADTADYFANERLGRLQPNRSSAGRTGEGGTLAVERKTYFELGGHDEAFLGWGGEDNEFFDRLRTVRLYDHAYLPFVHLHHGPQPGKHAANANTSYFEARMRIPALQRIAELSRRDFRLSRRAESGVAYQRIMVPAA